mmetsp:Transcript_21096/g.58955  ORF Transcript_21096/g.58955 Transcript_21096/m.58955 type:complete len:204 (-) Transcript_21096:160-771(-)
MDIASLRPRAATAQDYGLPPENVFLASSWPGAAPEFSRLHPDPPRAPKRGPTRAMWDVPLLELPAARRKRSPSGSSTSDTCQSLEDGVPRCQKDDGVFGVEEEDDEANDVGIFSFEPNQADDDELELGTSVDVAFALVDLDDHTELDQTTKGCATRGIEGSSRSRCSTTDACMSLGASPVLLSVFEHFSAEARRQQMPRQTMA